VNYPDLRRFQSEYPLHWSGAHDLTLKDGHYCVTEFVHDIIKYTNGYPPLYA